MKRLRTPMAAALLGLPLICWLASPLMAQTPTAAPVPSPPPATSSSTSPAVAPAVPAPQNQTVIETDNASRQIAEPARAPRDLSPWSMFLAADVFVKGVMVSLVLASFVTWTIVLAKSAQIAAARRQLRAGLSQIAEARTLSEAQASLPTDKAVLSALLRAAVQELKLSGDGGSDEGIKERAASRFAEITRAQARAMRGGMSVLGTIGATAPFVGLFGTVWGIMNSFIGISKAQTTNLAVVAPGIAEALLATAIGLIAAIPAVIFYNYLARATKDYLELSSRCSGAIGRLLSRDLDRRRGPLLVRAAE
jgi:biopolymer transport protein ExbB